MKKRELLARIEALENRIRDLESRPVYVPLPAYGPPAPGYGQLPTFEPNTPYWQAPTVTCGGDTSKQVAS